MHFLVEGHRSDWKYNSNITLLPQISSDETCQALTDSNGNEVFSWETPTWLTWIRGFLFFVCFWAFQKLSHLSLLSVCACNFFLSSSPQWFSVCDTMEQVDKHKYGMCSQRMNRFVFSIWVKYVTFTGTLCLTIRKRVGFLKVLYPKTWRSGHWRYIFQRCDILHSERHKDPSVWWMYTVWLHKGVIMSPQYFYHKQKMCCSPPSLLAALWIMR